MHNKKVIPTTGISLILLAELCFASATVMAKHINNHTSIPSIEITFFRFFLGIFLSYYYMKSAKIPFRPNNWNLVIRRGVLNTLAVIFFFMSVQYTTVTNANMLNMTYPIFIFAVTLFLNREKTPPFYIILLGLSMIGIYLVIHPDFGHIRSGDILGILSGITAAFGVITLKEATQYDHTALILFYLMIIGTIINLLLMIPFFVLPSRGFLLLMLLSAFIGFLGQVFLTSGYYHVGARAGGMLSSSRILYATILGALFFKDPLGWKVVLGGGLILSTLIGLGWHQTQQSDSQTPDFDKTK